jgi:hypothetical protein
MIPALVVLALNRYKFFEERVRSLIKRLANYNIRKIVIILYIAAIPFSITHLVHVIRNKNLVFNPLQMYSLINRVNALEGDRILSSWEGYSVYSKKEPLLKEGYVSAYINMYVSYEKGEKYGVIYRSRYEDLIKQRVPDVIVYDPNNLANIEGFEFSIAQNYETNFNCNGIIVYTKR